MKRFLKGIFGAAGGGLGGWMTGCLHGFWEGLWRGAAYGLFVGTVSVISGGPFFQPFWAMVGTVSLIESLLQGFTWAFVGTAVGSQCGKQKRSHQGRFQTIDTIVGVDDHPERRQ